MNHHPKYQRKLSFVPPLCVVPCARMCQVSMRTAAGPLRNRARQLSLEKGATEMGPCYFRHGGTPNHPSHEP